MQVCSRVAGGRSSTMTVPVVFGPVVAPPTTAPAPAPTTAPTGPPTIAPATAPVVAPVAAPASVALAISGRANRAAMAAKPMMLERMVSLLGGCLVSARKRDRGDTVPLVGAPRAARNKGGATAPYYLMNPERSTIRRMMPGFGPTPFRA